MIGYPTTPEAAATVVYENGRRYQRNCCAYEVIPSGRHNAAGHQCERLAHRGPGNLYCQAHAKVVDAAVEARRKMDERKAAGTWSL